jgi:hypothetical protein
MVLVVKVLLIRTWHYVPHILDDKIYALGGFDGMDRIRCAERYSPHSNQWEVIPSMLCQRSDGSAAALNDKVSVLLTCTDL